MENLMPLTGIKVVDLTRVVAGPVCTMNLAQMGAEIVKVEAPKKGDDTRANPPFIGGESAYFLLLNGGKRSLTLDLKQKEGKEILWKLIETADVFVENFRPGVANKLGFSYAAVSAKNPRIIYCSISGYGSDVAVGAYDPIIQGESGVMSITGDPEGKPTKVAIAIADLVSALYAVQGILYALRLREKTGKGRYVDISMLGAMASLLHMPGSVYIGTGENPKRLGNVHVSFAPFQLYSTQDGYMNIACGNDSLWHSLCDAIGMSLLKDDPRFASNKDRVANRDEMNAILDGVLKKKTTKEWCDLLAAAGVPSGKVSTLADVFNDPKLTEKDYICNVDHPKAGRVQVLGNPVKISDVKSECQAAPVLGANNHEILASLGYSKEQVAGLEKAGII